VFLAVFKAKWEVILVQGLGEQYSATTGRYSRLQVGGWRDSIRPSRGSSTLSSYANLAEEWIVGSANVVHVRGEERPCELGVRHRL
jgi:hypothetical protein